MSTTTLARRKELAVEAGQTILNLLAAGIPWDRITIPMIASSMGFSSVYVSTRVGISEAQAQALKIGLAEKHPQLICQLALAGDRRVKRLLSIDELVKAFREAIK